MHCWLQGYVGQNFPGSGLQMSYCFNALQEPLEGVGRVDTGAALPLPGEPVPPIGIPVITNPPVKPPRPPPWENPPDEPVPPVPTVQFAVTRTVH